jgi:ubiquitin-conjugating enzyme E2 S
LLTIELNALKAQPHEGIDVLVNEEDLTDVQADILGPRNAYLITSEGTPYEGGKFRVRLVVGADYPNSAPKGK